MSLPSANVRCRINSAIHHRRLATTHRFHFFNLHYISLPEFITSKYVNFFSSKLEPGFQIKAKTAGVFMGPPSCFPKPVPIRFRSGILTQSSLSTYLKACDSESGPYLYSMQGTCISDILFPLLVVVKLGPSIHVQDSTVINALMCHPYIRSIDSSPPQFISETLPAASVLAARWGVSV